jgi:hypothetical protein
MYEKTACYSESFEIGRAAIARAQSRWETYEAATRARKEIEETVGFELGDLSSDDYVVVAHGFGNLIQYRWWAELQKNYPPSPHKEDAIQFSRENTFPLGLDVDVTAAVQKESDKSEDTPAITPNTTSVHSVRIMERLRVPPIAFEGEFQDQEDEFQYTAGSISPKKIAVRKIRISKRKPIKPNIFSDEFEDLDQD